jgi:hypothetical protein
MEANQFQEFLADELRKRSGQAGVSLPVRKINNTTDKIGRVQSLQPLLASGTLRLSRRHSALLDQLRQFPMGAHDDGLDALEMAAHLAGRNRGVHVIDPAPHARRRSRYDDHWMNEHMWTTIIGPGARRYGQPMR